MATKPKKTTLKKKVSAPKITDKKSTKKSNLKKNIFIFLGVNVLIGLISFGYFLGKENTSKELFISEKHEESYTTAELLEDLSKIKTKNSESIVTKEEVLKVVKKVQVQPLFEERGKKTKLVIIIDDVSSKAQMKQIKALGMKITPSIFPPSELSMKSHKLAFGVKNYMIHLPMESASKQFNKQYKTLKTSFTKEEIHARVKELRKLFPTAKYVNNHTGSIFTDHYKAMYTLYSALRQEGFMFVDSRTISSSKVEKIAHEFGDVYVARNIFIDNEHKVSYIHKQLRKAVNIAKKKGYAVAIGHPHKVTMKALKSAKYILKDVELVYLDAIYRGSK